MERLFLITNFANYLVQTLLFLAATLAARRFGGPAARTAALVNAIVWPLTTASGFLPLADGSAVWIAITLDVSAGAGFLCAAARHNSLWISVAVLAQGVQTAIDVFYIGEASSFDRLHHFVIGAADNIFTCVMQIAILGAALADRRRLASDAPLRV